MWEGVKRRRSGEEEVRRCMAVLMPCVCGCGCGLAWLRRTRYTVRTRYPPRLTYPIWARHIWPYARSSPQSPSCSTATQEQAEAEVCVRE